MRKGTDIIGKPVITRDDGIVTDTIYDIIFDHKQHQVLGFVVDEGGLLTSARVLPLMNVSSIGADAVTIDDTESVITADKNDYIYDVLSQPVTMKGLTVMTEGGKQLGKITDLYFDEKNGKVVGYEASGGMFSDLYSGRSFIPTQFTVRLGQDVVFVPDETVQLMEEQEGGLKGAVQEFSDRAQAKISDVQERAKEAYTDVKEKTAEKVGAYRDRVEETVTQRAAITTIDQAKGRRVSHTIYGENGLIIAAAGQIVNDQIITDVKRYHKEQALLESVNMSLRHAAKTKTRDMVGRVQSQTDEMSERAKNIAAEVWEKTKEQVREITHKASDGLEEQRIVRAVGRPVVRVILDKNDQVILNTGDIVTYAAIDRARESGVLEVLLRSVETHAPVFSKTERRFSHDDRNTAAF